MNLRRSPTRSRWERWRKEITGKRPYRCRMCRWRGWKPIGIGEADLGSSEGRPAPPDPPNLKGTLLARGTQRLAVDVKELDRFHSLDRDNS
jgi:hypothetical protein